MEKKSRYMEKTFCSPAASHGSLDRFDFVVQSLPLVTLLPPTESRPTSTCCAIESYLPKVGTDNVLPLVDGCTGNSYSSPSESIAIEICSSTRTPFSSLIPRVGLGVLPRPL
jgi:hypothetical protein